MSYQAKRTNPLIMLLVLKWVKLKHHQLKQVSDLTLRKRIIII